MRKFLSLLVVLLTTFTSAWADEPEYVEIGGLRWATKNLGATTVADSPETAYGDYYAWGEVATYYTSITYTTGSTPTWKTNATDTHITGAKTGYDWTNYCGNSSFTEWSPAPYDASSKNLISAYDVANKKLGSTWRMPTSTEFLSLWQACGFTTTEGTPTKSISASENIAAKGVYRIDYTGTTITIDGKDYNVPGMLFVADATDTSKRVFFPAAGTVRDTEFNTVGSSGYYWSSSLRTSGDNNNGAYSLYLSSSDVKTQYNASLYRGFSVRPVQTITNYLCFTAEEANSSVTFSWASGSVQTSLDGTTFSDYTAGTEIPLNVGEKVYFKGASVTTNYNNHFTMTGKIAASGDVTSLTNGTGGNATLSTSCYVNMFRDCKSLTTAPNLPSTTLAEKCYWCMFFGCSTLSKVTVSFTDWNTSNNSTLLWLKDAASTGTFICPIGLDVTTTKDASHVPEGWNVVNKQVSTEADLTAAITNTLAGEVIQLTGDIDLTATITVAKGKDFTLDLNGHVLNAGNLATPVNKNDKANVIYSEGTLTIKDSNPTNAHTDWNTSHPTSAGNADLSAVKGGVLTGGKGYHNGSFIFGGAITVKSEASSLTMTGGTITGNTAGCGGGICSDGNITVTGTTISNNSATVYGGGILVGGGTGSSISGCTITGNTAAQTGGGGVFAYMATLTLDGKNNISGNTMGGKSSNLLYVQEMSTYTLGDNFDKTSTIGITTLNSSAAEIACQFTTNGTADDVAAFTSDNDKYAFLYKTDHLETSLIHRADADLDAQATVNDYGKVLNYTLTPATTPAYPTKNVLFLNADANKDGNVNVSDLTAIVDSLYKDAANKAKGQIENGKWKMENSAAAENVDGLTLAVSGNTLTISADNASAFLAAQMDIMLPEGIVIADAQSAGHTVYNKVQEDGSTRVIIAGLQNNNFAGNNVATLTLSEPVSVNVNVENAIFTNSAFQSVAAKANSTTGISQIENGKLKIENSGKFIENGAIIIVKDGKKFTTSGQMMK